MTFSEDFVGADLNSMRQYRTSGSNFWAVNVACLDDVTEEELAGAPVIYEDGTFDHPVGGMPGRRWRALL